MKRVNLERLFAKALAELDLSARVADSLPRAPRAPNEARTVRVVAIGKGAPAMAAGAIARWGEHIERCLVVAPDDTDTAALRSAARAAHLADRLVVMHSAHPVPDARSVRAAEACFEMVTSDERRTVLVLVSGGASALVCAPSAGITLRTKREVTRVMLRSGASVRELNVVRKHLSRIKGGGLAQAAAPNDVLTLVASDVIGGTAADVGSGPSIIAPTPVAAARRILRRFAPSLADLPLVRSPSGSPSRAKIIASPEELARIYTSLLRERGISVRILPPSQAPAGELAEEYVELAQRSRRGVRVYVRAAEPSVIIPSRHREGRGGRSTHLAALVGRALAVGSRGFSFAALASDGVDGTSGCGGAIVDERFDADAADRAIPRFDTGPLHAAMGTAVASCPSGHNLADLHVLVVK